jgi:hypothetical protein
MMKRTVDLDAGLGRQRKKMEAKVIMGSNLNENFGEEKPKRSVEEALQPCPNLCGVVKNPSQWFCLTDEDRNKVIHQESPQPSPSSTIPCASCPQEPVPGPNSKQSHCVIDIADKEICSTDITSVAGEEKEADEGRNKVVQIVKQKNLNSLKKLGGVHMVASLLGSNLEVIIRSLFYS